MGWRLCTALVWASVVTATGCVADTTEDEDIGEDAAELEAATEALDEDETTADSDDAVVVGDDMPEPAEAAPAAERVRVMTANVYFGAMYPKNWRQVGNALCPGRKLSSKCVHMNGNGGRQAHWVTWGIAQGLADEVKRIGDVAILGAQETNNPNFATNADKLTHQEDFGRKHIIAQEIARRLQATTGKPWRYDDLPATCTTGRIGDQACRALTAGTTVYWRADLFDLVSVETAPRGTALLLQTKSGKRMVFHTALLTGKHGDQQAPKVAAWARGELAKAKTVVSGMDMNETNDTGVRHSAFRAAGFVTTRKAPVAGVPWLDFLWANRDSSFVKFQQVSSPFGSDHRARWADVKLR